VRALWSDSALALDPRSTGLGKMVQEPRAGFYVAEWRMFCHSAWLQISPARLQQVYSDSARARFYVTKWGVFFIQIRYKVTRSISSSFL